MKKEPEEAIEHPCTGNAKLVYRVPYSCLAMVIRLRREPRLSIER